MGDVAVEGTETAVVPNPEEQIGEAYQTLEAELRSDLLSHRVGRVFTRKDMPWPSTH